MDMRRDQFHASPAAEFGIDELRWTHGVAVMICRLRRPSLTEPWRQLWGHEVMSRIVSHGDAWQAVR